MTLCNFSWSSTVLHVHVYMYKLCIICIATWSVTIGTVLLVLKVFPVTGQYSDLTLDPEPYPSPPHFFWEVWGEGSVEFICERGKYVIFMHLYSTLPHVHIYMYPCVCILRPIWSCILNFTCYQGGSDIGVIYTHQKFSEFSVWSHVLSYWGRTNLFQLRHEISVNTHLYKMFIYIYIFSVYFSLEIFKFACQQFINCVQHESNFEGNTDFSHKCEDVWKFWSPRRGTSWYTL